MDLRSKNVFACSDFSTNECGDIVVTVFDRECVHIQKEGRGTVTLSNKVFINMLNAFWDRQNEIKKLKEMDYES